LASLAPFFSLLSLSSAVFGGRIAQHRPHRPASPRIAPIIARIAAAPQRRQSLGRRPGPRRPRRVARVGPGARGRRPEVAWLCFYFSLFSFIFVLRVRRELTRPRGVKFARARGGGRGTRRGPWLRTRTHRRTRDCQRPRPVPNERPPPDRQ